MIDEAINKAIKKAVDDAMERHFNTLMKELKEIKQMKKAESTSEKMNFLLPEEAQQRLKISRPTLDRLMKDGELKFQKAPKGRVRILESSVNEYIAREAGL